MKVPVSWLNDYVDIDVDYKTLAEKLVNVGFELEEIIDLGAEIQGVVTGKIERILPHPNADKLTVCTVNIGADAPLTIVTGAKNVFEGAIVPVATDGATIAEGKRIFAGDLRGVMSEGMFCGGEEIAADEYDYHGASVYGVLILDEGTPLGVDINEILGRNEIVLDVGVTSNRPDCNSIIGIAKEVAAALGKTLKTLPDYSVEAVRDYTTVKVSVNSPVCTRYMAKQFKNVRIQPSPAIIAKRLKMVGIRPINNIVDMTNYVLIELGQPMHAFDEAMIDEIVVRQANEGEKIVALNDTEYTLSPADLVIANGAVPVAIAGVMGGQHSGISDTTTAVVLESANFRRESVRRTSRRLNLRSDSSFRFEKGIDMYSQEAAIRRCVSLMCQYGWGVPCDGVVDVVTNKVQPAVVTFTAEDIRKILGIYIDETKIVSILAALGFGIEQKKSKGVVTITATAPGEREDIEGVNDIAEEVIRYYGYDNIVGTLMDDAKQTMGGKSPFQLFLDDVHDYLVARGYSEQLTYGFTTPKYQKMLRLDLGEDIRILNPLGEDLSVMRQTLLHSTLTSLKTNYTRGNREAKLYEIARVFIPVADSADGLPYENTRLSIGAYGAGVDFYTLKNLIFSILRLYKISASIRYSEHPSFHSGRSADLYVGDKYAGTFGELHPKVCEAYDYDKRLYAAELDMDVIFGAVDMTFAYTNISKFPSVWRDIAVEVDEGVLAETLINTAMEAGVETLRSATVFDVYKGDQVAKGKKSVAIKLEFAADRTLKDEELSQGMFAVVDHLSRELGAILRR